MLLAGDIGGTKTNLAIVEVEDGVLRIIAEQTFPSAKYRSLEAVVEDFLAHAHYPIECACFGVAGPVTGSRAEITNLPWVLEEQSLRNHLSLSTVRLINDLESVAYGVTHLGPDDLHTLHEATPEPGGTIAVIAPGTGLGEGYLVWEGTRYRAKPSEGGHTSFSPTDHFQIGLLTYMLTTFDHVSHERLCSGIGIPNLYSYVRHCNGGQETPWVAEQLAQASDPTPIIAEAALADPPCPLCLLTMRTFVAILGAEAGNLALKTLATGGVFIGGGIPPRILPLLTDKRFLNAFRHKGRFADLLTRIPVRIIMNRKVALLGAAHFAAANL